ncbi:MAG: hypothetical protein V9E81_07290 [Marmoricola sp.]
MKANTKLIALTTTSAVRTPGLFSARVSGGAGVAALVSSTSQRTGFITHSAAAVASTGIKNAMGRMGAETIKPPSAGPTTKDPTSTVTSSSVARMLCTRAMVGKAAAVAGKAGVAVATASEAQITATNGEPAGDGDAHRRQEGQSQPQGHPDDPISAREVADSTCEPRKQHVRGHATRARNAQPDLALCVMPDQHQEHWPRQRHPNRGERVGDDQPTAGLV